MKIACLNLNKQEPVQEQEVKAQIITEPIQEMKEEETKSFSTVDQEIARMSTYENKELGLEAFYYDTDSETGEIVYRVVTNEGRPYLAKYLYGIPFICPTYYDDGETKWCKEYNENDEEINCFIINSDENMEDFTGEISETVDTPIGEDWNVDKNELYVLADQIHDNLVRMDEILQYYIETNGNTVSEINDALIALNSINAMLSNTDEYYTEPESTED